MNPAQFGMDTISLAGGLDAKLRAVRKAGFEQVMLSARDIADHAAGQSAAITAVRASGLRVTGFQVLRDFEGLTGHLHDYKIDVAKAMLGICRELGSKLLLVCSSASTHASGDPQAMSRDLAKLAMLAVPFGIRIAYEALSWGRHVNEYRQAWDMVERADRANLGLALDSFHLLATRSTLDDLDLITANKLFLVQLSDFMWQEVRSPEERRETARHFRVFPGEGVHGEAVVDFARRLDAMGYRGDYSFEVFNDDYGQLPLEMVCERAAGSVRWLTGQVARHGMPRSRPAARHH